LDLYPYKSGLGLVEPVALIGYNVCIISAGVRHYRKVRWLEAIPPFQFLNIGAVAAASTSAKTQAVNLEAWDGEFVQLRWFVLDNVQVRMYLPQATGRIVLKRIQGIVDMNTPLIDPDLHLTEIFYWEDRVPWFEAINAGDYATLATRLKGMGYRFITDRLSDAEVESIKKGLTQCSYLPSAGEAGQEQ